MSPSEIFWDVHVPLLLARARDTTIRELTAVANFHLRGDGGGDWMLVIRRGRIVSAGRGIAAGPTVSVTLDADEFIGIATGAVDHRESFFAGRVEVEGDVELLLWVANLIPLLRQRFPFEPADYR